jgi:hypothetical protein
MNRRNGGPYYCVYDARGRPLGHVRIEDIETERAAYPERTYVEARLANRLLAEDDATWEDE